MFDIGFGELLLIAVVALVVLGPERLPGAARTVGALLRRAREGWNSVRNEVEREMQTDEVRRQLRDAAQELHRGSDVMRETVREASDTLHGRTSADAGDGASNQEADVSSIDTTSAAADAPGAHEPTNDVHRDDADKPT